MPPAHITVSHDGTAFEMLNPRKSLDTSRIVSFIDDTDRFSTLANSSYAYAASRDPAETLVEEEAEHEDQHEYLHEYLHEYQHEYQHEYPHEYPAVRQPHQASLHSSLQHLPSTYPPEASPKIPSPSPGMDLTNPFASLPRCTDLPRTPRHLIRPGPLSNQPSLPELRTFYQCESRQFDSGNEDHVPWGVAADGTGRSRSASSPRPDFGASFSDAATLSVLDRTGPRESVHSMHPWSHTMHPWNQSMPNINPIRSPEDGGGRSSDVTTAAADDDVIIHTWLPKPGTDAMKKRKRKADKERTRGKMSKFGLGWVYSLFRSGR